MDHNMLRHIVSALQAGLSPDDGPLAVSDDDAELQPDIAVRAQAERAEAEEAMGCLGDARAIRVTVEEFLDACGVASSYIERLLRDSDCPEQIARLEMMAGNHPYLELKAHFRSGLARAFYGSSRHAQDAPVQLRVPSEAFANHLSSRLDVDAEVGLSLWHLVYRAMGQCCERHFQYLFARLMLSSNSDGAIEISLSSG